MEIAFKAGQAPWEVEEQSSTPEIAFKAGQAPWEVEEQPTQETVNTDYSTKLTEFIQDQVSNGVTGEALGKAVQDFTKTIQAPIVNKPENTTGSVEPTKLTDFMRSLPDDISPEDKQKEVTQFKIDNSNPEYLKSTIDNPLVATGNAIMSTGAGLNKIVEDVTGLDLHSKEAIDNSKTVGSQLSGGTKLTGDVLGATALSGSSLPIGATQVALQQLGEGHSYLTSAGIGLGTFLGGKLMASVVDKIASKLGNTSEGAKLLKELNQGRITEEQFSKEVTTLPKEDQAIIMVETDKLYGNFMKDAARKGGDDVMAKLGKRLESRHNIVRELAATEDDMVKSQNLYNAMRSKIAEELPHTSTPHIDDKVNKILTDIYATDISNVGTTIRKVQQDMSGELTVSDAINIRENINGVLGNSSLSKQGKWALGEIKESVDGFIDSSMVDRPDLQKAMREVIDNYRVTVNDYKLGKALTQASTNDFGTDWGKLRSLIKKEGINGDKVEYLKPILKELERVYVNDAEFGKYIKPEGAKESNILSLYGRPWKIAWDLGNEMLGTERGRALALQRELVNSLKGSQVTYEQRLEKLKKVKNLPDDGKEQLDAIINEIEAELPKPAQIEYKRGMKSTGDINVKPAYATPEGTIGSDASQVTLHDRQRDLVRKALGNKYEDNVVNKISESIESKRFEGILSNTRKKLKVDEANHNMKVVKTIVKDEANQLIKRIESSVGVKLPKEEAEKIIKIKLGDVLKDYE